MAGQDDDLDDLMGVDLSSVDLTDIDVGDESKSSAGRWLAGLFFLGLMVTVLWLPSTVFYAQYGHTNWFFFMMCGAAAIVGLTGGRWLWGWAEEAAAKWAAQRRVEPEEPPQPPSAAQRWLTLLVALVGGGLLLFWLPQSGLLGAGGAADSTWFVASVGAVAVGIVLGRWLIMQPVGRDEPAERPRPIVLPPWFKWVSLVVLVGGGGAILMASIFYGESLPEEVQFSMGGAALVLGIGGAIWLVRRFDEAEQRIREETLRRRRGLS